jgi:hypothetical protein
MLPSAEMKVIGPWVSYEHAERTFSEIIPHQTTTVNLAKINLDPRKNSNITLLNYSDIIRRFVPPGSVSGFELDSNLLDCISNGLACSGFEIRERHILRKRYGNFFLDFFNFERKTKVTGWEFNAVLIIKDDLVVYKLISGQPAIQEYEEANNPLGPLQAVVPIVSPLR